MAQTALQGIVQERLKFREKLAYGLGDMACNVVWGGVGAFATYYYTNSAGMAAAAIGTMFMISRVFDGVSDLIMGLIIDRTRSRFGKARPWLLWMAIPFAVAAVLLFSVPQNWGAGAKLIYAYITYNLLGTVVYTAINLSYGTMTALITDDSKDRTLLNVFRMLGSVIMGIIVNIAVMPMVNGFGGGPGAWRTTFIILGTVGAGLFFLCFAGTKERVGASAKKEDVVPIKAALGALFRNKYWYLIVINGIIGSTAAGTMGVNIYFAKYWLNDETLVGVLSMTTMLPLLIGLFFMAPLVVKVGKRNLMLIGCLVLITGIIVQILGVTSLSMVLAGGILRGLGMVPMAAVGFVITADVIDYGEWKTGIRTEGLVYSASSLGTKVGTGLGAGALGWSLAFGNFDAALDVQDTPAKTAILFVFVYLPLILYCLSSVILLFYKLDKQLPQILIDLKERHLKAGALD
ncbi:MAG: glycoside-pentoside-hexuronide (GPH):cation symporter [Treponema sp.]|jgi:GPH family glycoside/pentoside/hexuronide:cation symporter|nr:glycoside-pentoside-hexuronide (GPH):cation symporter [Treponema sp.]